MSDRLATPPLRSFLPPSCPWVGGPPAPRPRKVSVRVCVRPCARACVSERLCVSARLCVSPLCVSQVGQEDRVDTQTQETVGGDVQVVSSGRVRLES